MALVLRRIVCHRTRDAVLQVNSLEIPLALPLGCHGNTPCKRRPITDCRPVCVIGLFRTVIRGRTYCPGGPTLGSSAERDGPLWQGRQEVSFFAKLHLIRSFEAR